MGIFLHRPLAALVFACYATAMVFAGPVAGGGAADRLPPAVPASLRDPLPAMTVWDKPVPHLFLHPLIEQPGIAFAPGQWQEHLYEWFITCGEFRRILDSLEARGFVLVDFMDTVEPAAGGGWRWRSVKVPAGRTPLVISVDDLNYYAEMRWNGTASRLEVDEKGRLVSRSFRSRQVSVDARSGDVVRPDGDIPGILEDFLALHPDFAMPGARGIIALTGKRGLFGWPTHLGADKDHPRALEGARGVAKWLKDRGWRFASHSYFHLHKKEETPEAFAAAERRWIAETRQVLGPVGLYIYPYGEPLHADPAKAKVLRDLGYRFVFTVEDRVLQGSAEGFLVQGRIPLDGRALDGRFGRVGMFFDRAQVRDPDRPARKP